MNDERASLGFYLEKNVPYRLSLTHRDRGEVNLLSTMAPQETRGQLWVLRGLRSRAPTLQNLPAHLTSLPSSHLLTPPKTEKCHFPSLYCSGKIWVKRNLRNKSFIQEDHGNQSVTSWQELAKQRTQGAHCPNSFRLFYLSDGTAPSFFQYIFCGVRLGTQSSVQRLQARVLRIPRGALFLQTLTETGPCPGPPV